MAMGRLKHHSAYLPGLHAAQALLKFCEDHGRPYPPLRALVTSLEAEDVSSAKQQFATIPFGGMGTFNDWIPPVAFEHETGQYVWTLFEALTERFFRLMQQLLTRFCTN